MQEIYLFGRKKKCWLLVEDSLFFLVIQAKSFTHKLIEFECESFNSFVNHCWNKTYLTWSVILGYKVRFLNSYFRENLNIPHFQLTFTRLFYPSKNHCTSKDMKIEGNSLRPMFKLPLNVGIFVQNHIAIMWIKVYRQSAYKPCVR